MVADVAQFSEDSCSSHPDTKEANFKKGTTANGLTTVNSGFVGF